jgi:predicted dehydrogenase
VFDSNNKRNNSISKQYNTRIFDNLNSLIQSCDALSIVTPTQYHAEIAEQCIRSNKHVFIEKPITGSLAEADNILRLANNSGVIVQVGHIERLNPALLALDSYTLKPKYIEVQRLAPYTTRGTEVPVVLDLMIHDIDIVLALVKSQVDTIHASGLSIMTDSVDIANARIQFVDGTIANITSSRIAKDKVRKLKAFQNEMYVTIDFLLGLTEVYRIVKNKGPKGLAAVPLNENEKNKQIIYEKPTVSSFDPLRMELSNFIDSIKGKTKPIVSGSDGREALKVAIQIHEMIIKDLH